MFPKEGDDLTLDCLLGSAPSRQELTEACRLLGESEDLVSAYVGGDELRGYIAPETDAGFIQQVFERIVSSPRRVPEPGSERLGA